MSASQQAVPAETARADGLARADQLLTVALEAITALLVVAEIVILFVGIVARYAFHSPLIWSDELASLLFLWLSMLGAVLALRRNQHMRMTALVNRAGPGLRQFFNDLALAAALAFLIAIFAASIDYVRNEAIVSIMSLNLSMAWRAAAMPVGVALMIVTALLRLERDALLRAGLALAVVGAAFAGFWLLHPMLLQLGRLNLVIFFLGVVSVTVFLGVPIAISFGLATLGYLALSTHVPISVLVARMDTGMSHPELLAVPLFVFLGLLIEMTGMARVMVRFLANLLGHLRGGLSFVLIGAMYLVSGISGSKAADMAAIAPVLFPEMVARGAQRGELVALLAATGAQTETIPPSLILITIGSVTGISISALFTGGLVPGLVVGLILCVMTWWRAGGAGVGAAGGMAGGMQRAPRATAGAIGRSFVVAIPALVLPFVIRGAVVWRHRDCDRGFYDRHRLCHDRRPADLSPVRLGAVAADAGADRIVVRRDPADHRRGDQHGLGDHRALAFPSWWRTGSPACRAARYRSWRSRSCCSPCSAAFWRASPRSCCSARCCFRSRIRWASTRCTTRWWRSWRWAWGCSRRRSGLATTSPARSVAPIRTTGCGISGAIWRHCWWG